MALSYEDRVASFWQAEKDAAAAVTNARLAGTAKAWWQATTACEEAAKAAEACKPREAIRHE